MWCRMFNLDNVRNCIQRLKQLRYVCDISCKERPSNARPIIGKNMAPQTVCQAFVDIHAI